jgi:hypothetical protein
MAAEVQQQVKAEPEWDVQAWPHQSGIQVGNVKVRLRRSLMEIWPINLGISEAYL